MIEAEQTCMGLGAAALHIPYSRHTTQTLGQGRRAGHSGGADHFDGETQGHVNRADSTTHPERNEDVPV